MNPRIVKGDETMSVLTSKCDAPRARLFEQRRRDGNILQFNYFNVGNLQSLPFTSSISLTQVC